MTGPEPEWLTLGRAARVLGVAQSTLRIWADEGRVPAFTTPGGHRRFRQDDLERFLGRAPQRPTHRVLLVTADGLLRELMRVGLEREGYGLLAVEATEAPDLVILDVTTPGLAETEVLRAVQERHGLDVLPVLSYGAAGTADAQALVALAKRMLG